MADAALQRREYVRFAFYKVGEAWRGLDQEARLAAAAEVENVVNRFAEGMMIRPYSTVGMRADTDICFWSASHELASIQDFATAFAGTELEKHSPAGQERLQIRPSKARYVFVYPFVKTRQWYLLPKAERQRIMDEHIAVGHRYPTVKINTTYSFGLDDQDFVVAFETDEPSDFLDLVMELRETEGSVYTVRDTPIFTCVGKPLS